MTEDVIKIRRLNDRFRQGDVGVRGDVLVTAGLVDMMESDERATPELFQLVRDYNAFTKDNDPWGEHDFGSFEFRGETCFWKIDVYDPECDMAAFDPTHPELSRRVLTIMLAGEY